MKLNTNHIEKNFTQAEWGKLMALFEELRSLAGKDREVFLVKKNLSHQLKAKLIQMLEAFNRTESFVDTPLTARITTEFDGYAESLVGQKLNEYQLLELLSEGMLTSVYRASQQEPVPRMVAIKMIRPDAPDDSKPLFRLESTALAKLSHPNIATIYTVEADQEGTPFIVMEYINGPSLIPYCDACHLMVDDRLSLFLQVCAAITYSHQRGILHRDIKSSNILITEYDAGTPVPTVIDFGISGHVGQGSGEIEAQIMGTPEYMSPEHLKDGGDVDIRSDVYSLGMVLFSLLVGKIPFNRHQFADSDYPTRKQMIADFQPPAPSQYFCRLSAEKQNKIANLHGVNVAKYRKVLTAELDWIYSRATAKDPERRYQSVAELVEDIRRYRSNEILQAKPVSLFYRFRKSIQRHFVLATALATGSLMVSLFVAAVIKQNQQIKVEFERAEKERDVSRQVFDLISTFLSSATPWTMGDKTDVTVESMLEIGMYQLNNNHGLSPEVKYTLFLRFAEAYKGIGKPEKAKLINDLVLTRQDFPDVVTDIEANISASKLLRLMPDNKQQLRLAQRAYELCMQNNVSGVLLIRALRRLGNSYYALGLFTQAKESLVQAFTVYEKEIREERPLKADIVLDLANVVYWLNDYEGAEQRYKQALRINRLFFSEEHARVVKNKVHLAELWRIVGKPEQAIPVIKSSYAIQRKYLGDKHVDVLKTQGEMVRVYRYAKEFDEAELVALDLIPKLSDVFGESEDETIMFNLELGQIYKGQGRFSDAVAVLQRVHDLATKNRSELGDHLEPVIGYADKILGHALMFDGQLARALTHVNRAVAFHRAPATYNDFYIADSLYVRAGIHIDLDDFVSAEKDALEMINIYGPMLGTDHERVLKANTILSYARLRQSWTEEEFNNLSSSFAQLKERNPKDVIELERIEAWLACWQPISTGYECRE